MGVKFKALQMVLKEQKIRPIYILFIYFIIF
jgi:hypothetical protein